MLPENRDNSSSGGECCWQQGRPVRTGHLGQGTGALLTLAGALEEAEAARFRGMDVGGQDRPGGLVAAGDAVVGGKTRPGLINTQQVGQRAV